MSSDSESSANSSDGELDPAAHAAALKRLKSKDPDFYEFLKENDEKLLDYRDSSASDDEDTRDETADNDENLTEGENFNDVVLELNSLKNDIHDSPNIQSCKKLMSLMKHFINIADKSNDDQNLKLMDGSTFNEVMKLCLVELLPALQKVMKLKNMQSADVSKSKLWKRLITTVKGYLIDVLKILSFITEPTSLKLLLKHVVGLVIFYQQFVKLARMLLKKMIQLWSTAEEGIRVLALLVIVRVVKSLPTEYHPQVLKQMYFAYVKNTKFTSVTSWPLINFMKRSLSEVYAMHPEIAYEHTFVYLRQLSIHLRNAVTMKQKEAYQTVYNWQYMHCIMHWAHLISVLQHNEAMKTLIYPLVQTTIGTINLIPTLKYVPTRFHLIRTLIELSKETNVFISIPSLILDTLNLTDFNKKGTFTKKPINMSCALKASKSQLLESGFKDEIINEVCKLLLEYFSINSHKIGFPELALPIVVQLKQFLKKNKIAKYGQQLKTILDKLQENSDYITEQRKSVPFKITDYDEINKWENNVLQRGTRINISQKRPVSKETPDSPPSKKKKKQT